jgi:hypothetical protein
MEQTFEIKITGSGTPEQLVNALQELAKDIALVNSLRGAVALDGAEWEDTILVTEINAE